MGRTICFLKFVLLTLLFAIVGNAFQPYYHHRWRQHSYRRANILHQQCFYYHRRLVQLFYKQIDPSTIELNRQYLSTTLGLSEEKLDKIASFKGGGNILTREIGILDERVNWLKNRLSLNDNEIKKVIQSQHTILGRQSKSDTGLESKLDYLQTRLLLNDITLSKLIQRLPNSLTYSISDNLEPKLDWLQQRLELDDSALSKMIQRSPSILRFSIEDNMEPKLNWLQQRLELDDVALRKLIQRLPQILNLSITNNMEPKLEWLQERLMLDDTALNKMIQRIPSILQLSIEDNMELKLDWIQNRLSLTDQQLTKMIQHLPALFGYDIHNNLEPKLEWIQDRLNLDDTALSKLIPRAHTILSCSTDVLEDKLEWLQQRLYLTDDELSKIIQKQPSLLGCSIVSNLEPTLNFYIDALGKDEALAFVTSYPNSFTFSLEKRLKPRLKQALDAGMVVDSKLVSLINGYTNEEWDKKIVKVMGKR